MATRVSSNLRDTTVQSVVSKLVQTEEVRPRQHARAGERQGFESIRARMILG